MPARVALGVTTLLAMSTTQVPSAKIMFTEFFRMMKHRYSQEQQNSHSICFFLSDGDFSCRRMMALGSMSRDGSVRLIIFKDNIDMTYHILYIYDI